MKKFLAAVLATLMCISLAACGRNPSSGSGEKEDIPQPPDLIGEWKQTNSNSEDSYQSATITEDTIEIYWVSDGGDTKSLYWAGTYVAPTTADEPYVWDSENDHSKTDVSLLASGDDTKTMTYQDGVLSYEASALGTTMKIKLEKQ